MRLIVAFYFSMHVVHIVFFKCPQNVFLCRTQTHTASHTHTQVKHKHIYILTNVKHVFEHTHIHKNIDESHESNINNLKNKTSTACVNRYYMRFEKYKKKTIFQTPSSQTGL